jgi:hypothetical protein
MSAGPWGICERCGFKVRHRELRKEWTNLLVCKPCYDPRPADTRPPRIKPEGVPIRDARPEPEPRFVEPNEITKDDL